MRLALGSDHGGFDRKRFLVERLRDEGHEIIDVGVEEKRPSDYPIYAEKVGRLIASGKADFGILICTTGIGMCIAANKISGIRAGLAADPEMAVLTRRHNNANILCLAGGYLDDAQALEIAHAFISTAFDGNLPEGERHARRVAQINELDRI